MSPMELVQASPEPATLAIGAAAPTFEGLLATDGLRYGFSSFADREALVVIFSSNRCPTAKAYAESRLQQEINRRSSGNVRHRDRKSISDWR